jgi:hypothetical protein
VMEAELIHVCTNEKQNWWKIDFCWSH